MGKAGAPRKYKSAKSLRDAVNAYFDSISRYITAEETYDTGKKDKYGHKIYKTRQILNVNGDPVRYLEYVRPPTVAGLSDFLHIHRDTWHEYCDHKKHPEFSDTTTRAQERLRGWREEEVLIRPGKDVRGIMFDLQVNYGCTPKSEVEFGKRAANAMAVGNMSLAEKQAILIKVAAQFGGSPPGTEGGDADDADDGEPEG